MFLVSVATGHLPYQYSQEDVLSAYLSHTAGKLDPAWIQQLFASTQVQRRHFALSLDEIMQPRDFGDRNRLFTERAPALLATAIMPVLTQAGLTISDVDAVATATSTGFLTPSLSARLVDHLECNRDAIHLPLVGLGCAGGVSGLAHAMAWGKGRGARVLVAGNIELCSLTYDHATVDKANAVSAALFGDGVTAVLCRSDVCEGWEMVDAATYMHPRSQYLMGWDMRADGYGLVLSEEVPAAVAQIAPRQLRAFLARHRLQQNDVTRWVLHPGGPKILSALSAATGLDGAPIEASREGLRCHGNMSACSVLYSLAESLQTPASPGDTLMLVSFGPGFCMEMALLRYRK